MTVFIKPYKEIMIDQVKDFRVEIDNLAELVKQLKPLSMYIGEIGDGNLISQVDIVRDTTYNTIEILNAYDSLKLAKAWLGNVLRELGDDSPYKSDGKRETIEHIEPVADSSSIEGWEEQYTSLNHIQKVDWLREEIRKLVTKNMTLKYNLTVGDDVIDQAVRNHVFRVETHLEEAKFWLGFELQRIKEDG